MNAHDVDGCGRILSRWPVDTFYSAYYRIENILMSDRCQWFIIYYCKPARERGGLCICVFVCVSVCPLSRQDAEQYWLHIYTPSLSLSHTHKEKHTCMQRSRESLYKEVILLLMMLGSLVKDMNGSTQTHTTHRHTHMVCSKLLGFTKTGRDGHLINKLPKKL